MMHTCSTFYNIVPTACVSELTFTSSIQFQRAVSTFREIRVLRCDPYPVVMLDVYGSASLPTPTTRIHQLCLAGCRMTHAFSSVLCDMLCTHSAETLSRIDCSTRDRSWEVRTLPDWGYVGRLDTARILASCPLVTSINMGYNHIGPLDAMQVFREVGSHPSVTQLDMSVNHIGSYGIHGLANALRPTNTRVMHVNVYGNHIGPDGCRVLVDALQTNTSVTHLHIGCNGILPEGARCIYEVLSTNMTLTYLDMSCNRIGPDGGTSIARALQTNRSLTYLNISMNGITDAGATSIAEALRHNMTITHLYIGTNTMVTGQGALQLTMALEQSKTLVHLDMCTVPIRTQ
jgi:Ran GTPase-activating protein (RanGAP) involved in mRNA processing and transport